MDNKSKALIGAVIFGGAIAGLVLASKSTYVSPSPTPTPISPPSYTTITYTTQIPISPVTGTPTSSPISTTPVSISPVTGTPTSSPISTTPVSTSSPPSRTPTSSPISTTPVSTSSPPSNGVTLVNRCGNQVLVKVTNANGVELTYSGFNPGSQSLVQLPPDQFPLTVCFNNEAGGSWQCQKVTSPGTVIVPSSMCVVYNYTIKNTCSVPIVYVTPQEGSNSLRPGQSVSIQLYPGDQNNVYFIPGARVSIATPPKVSPNVSGNVITPSSCTPLVNYYNQYFSTPTIITYTVTNKCSQNLIFITSTLYQKVVPANSSITVKLPAKTYTAQGYQPLSFSFRDAYGHTYPASVSGTTITTTQCPPPTPTPITTPTPTPTPVSLNPSAPPYTVIGKTTSQHATVQFNAYCIAGSMKIPVPSSASIQIYKYAQVFGALSIGGLVANVHPFTKVSIPIGGPYVAIGNGIGTVSGSKTFSVGGNGTIEIDFQALPIYRYTYTMVQKFLSNGWNIGYRSPISRTLIGWECFGKKYTTNGSPMPT